MNLETLQQEPISSPAVRETEADSLANHRRELAEPVPQRLLTPITEVVEAFHRLTESEASVHEIVDLLARSFDCKTMMIYRVRGKGGEGLAFPVDGDSTNDDGGFKLRRHLIYDLYDSKYWKYRIDLEDEFVRNHIYLSGREEWPAHGLLMKHTDAEIVARDLWARFYPTVDVEGTPRPFPRIRFLNYWRSSADKLSEDPRIREDAKPEPRRLLVPIIQAVQAFSQVSSGEAKVPEIVQMLPESFDCDTMMMFEGEGYGLAEAYDGNGSHPHSGYNQRIELLGELFNIKYWKKVDGSEQVLRPGPWPYDTEEVLRLKRLGELSDTLDPQDLLMKRTDAVVMAESLWRRFFGEDTRKRIFPSEEYENLISRPFVSPDENPALSTAQPEEAARRWPWGDHHTEALGHLEAAAQRFWANYDPSDPSTAPTNDQVVAWLMERGATKNKADSIASILRADGLPSGPRR